MSDYAQLAALGSFSPSRNDRPAPTHINGLEALGRSSHGGAPVLGPIYVDVVAEELAKHTVPHNPYPETNATIEENLIEASKLQDA